MNHTHEPGEKWVTQDEALEKFGIVRQTLYNWRKKHVICEARLHKRLPRMFNLNDLHEADQAETRKNPVMRSMI